MNRIFFKISNFFKSKKIDFEDLKLHCIIVSQKYHVDASHITSIRKCNTIEELKVVIEQKLDVFYHFYNNATIQKIPLPDGIYTMLHKNGKKYIEFTLKNGKFVGECLIYYENGLICDKIIRDMKGRLTHLEVWSIDGYLLNVSKYKGNKKNVIYCKG